MKTTSSFYATLPSCAAGLLVACLNSATADPVKVETAAEPAVVEIVPAAITATGTVFSVEPDVLSVVMKDSPTPVRFYYNISTPLVDDKGEVIPLDLIRPELPLTVEYVMDGEKMVAKKVVITRSMVAGDANKKPSEKRGELAAAKAKEAAKEAETPESVSQTLIGTVSTLEQTISLVPRGETEAVSCIINNSTRFVNTAGEPVSSSLMRSGMPITVKTVRDGKRVLVQEVVVRGNPAAISTEGTGPRTTGPTGSRPGSEKIQSTPGATPPTPSAR